MVEHWLRFAHEGGVGLGTLTNGLIAAHEGDLFAGATPTGQTLSVDEVKLLMPTQPSKVIALWNNFKALGDKLQLDTPAEPLYFLKAPNSWLNPGEVIKRPSQPGRVVYEGELGIVIGKTAYQVPEANAMAHVFGYTCANDVTHADILHRDASFAQWVRSKGFDTFCPLGPVVATGLDPQGLVVKTMVNGNVRQEFPISDMRFSVAQLVHKISCDMTLFPGDIILCGTSLGVGSLKPGNTVEVEIDGIGKLSNRFE